MEKLEKVPEANKQAEIEHSTAELPNDSGEKLQLPGKTGEDHRQVELPIPKDAKVHIAELPSDSGEKLYLPDKSAESNNINSRSVPRQLEKTEQTWRNELDGSRVFDSPEETGKNLGIEQGKNPEFRGTCGLVSCENVLRLAGLDVTEKDIVDYARNQTPPLCWVDNPPCKNGGTTPFQRQKILNAFGVASEIQVQSIDTIAEAVESGKGVIISVDAGKFYDSPAHDGNGHALTVTSVKRGPNGEIQGFYICDSNSGTLGKTGAIYVEASKLASSFSSWGYCNITTGPIR